jgi:rhodanese-related sulfurtransferase
MKRIILWPSLLVIVSLLIFAPSVWASEFTIILTGELKSKLDAKEKLVLVNALTDIEFAMEHIPGSINICEDDIKTTDKLPQDKETLIVFHCMGGA